MTQHDELSIDIELDPAFDAGPIPTEDSGILDLRALLEEQRAAEAAGESRPLVAIAPPLVAERHTKPRSVPFAAWIASVAVFALSAIVYAAATPRATTSTDALPALAKHELSTGDHVPLPAQPVMVAASEPEPEPEPELAIPTPAPRVRARRPAPAPEPTRPEPTRPAPAHSWESGSSDGETALDGSIDALLDRALGGSADPIRETLPETPTRRQVSTTLRALEGEVRECAESGVARVRLVVDGATGRVSSATVSGEHAGGPVASCVAQAVRSAHFPRFERERFVITYPYVL